MKTAVSETAMENPRFNYVPRIMHAADETIRRAASSGGVVSALTEFLFKNGRIKTALTFAFDKNNLYSPRLIFKFDDYRPVGSIYHDIDLVKYIRDRAASIKSPVLITCRPCEVKAMRAIFLSRQIDSIIISLTCSAQMTTDATDYLLERERIARDNIISLQYRGNGWPSGVQIKTSRREYFFPNNESIWLHIFHSQIFTLKKCFSCRDTFGLGADLTVADPWLKRYLDSEKMGNTLVLPHSAKGEEITGTALAAGYLERQEEITREEALLSQAGTLKKKYLFRKSRFSRKIILPLIRSGIYRFLWKRIRFLPRLHFKLINSYIRHATASASFGRENVKG